MSKAIGFIAAFAAITFGALTGNAALVKFGVKLFGLATLSVVSQALAKKPRARRSGQEIEYFGTVEPRRIIYGQMRVSGMNTIPAWTSGTQNKYLHQVLTLAGHEVHDITDVYFGQTTIASSDISAVAGAATDGRVSAGTFANKAWLRRYKGTSAQTVDFILDDAFTQWTSNHRGRGVAYLACMFEYDEKVFQSGKPDVACLVKGKKVYDPRLDTTAGANPTNSSYIAYSTNPALCLTDYLLDSSIGLGEDATRIDWDLVVAAANACDEEVAIPGSTTQKRYTCNVVLEVGLTDADRRENIEALVGAMMGRIAYRGGKWRMHAGTAQSSVFDLDEDDVVGKISLRTEIPANEKYNYVRGQFVDKDRQYQLSEFEPRASASYESTDGGRFVREAVFPACVDQFEAQRNAIIVLKRSRRKKQVSMTLGLSAFRIRPWDVGTITLAEVGWADQLVRCMSWTMNQDGTIEASFLEELASDWDDPAVNEYYSPTTGTGPSPGAFVPDAPVNFTATGIPDGIAFTWQVTSQTMPGAVSFEIWEHTSASPFASATRVASNVSGASFTLVKSDTTTRYYWIRAREFYSDQVSGTRPDGDGIAAAALSVTSGFRATAYPSSLYETITGGSGTSSSTTITPANGVAPYSHSWVRQSGSTKISVTSATAATTTFSASGVSLGETATAIFRDTVTDSTGGTPLTTTVDVSVSFERESGGYIP